MLPSDLSHWSPCDYRPLLLAKQPDSPQLPKIAFVAYYLFFVPGLDMLTVYLLNKYLAMVDGKVGYSMMIAY